MFIFFCYFDIQHTLHYFLQKMQDSHSVVFVQNLLHNSYLLVVAAVVVQNYLVLLLVAGNIAVDELLVVRHYTCHSDCCCYHNHHDAIKQKTCVKFVHMCRLITTYMATW